jgi:hemerythrin
VSAIKRLEKFGIGQGNCTRKRRKPGGIGQGSDDLLVSGVEYSDVAVQDVFPGVVKMARIVWNDSLSVGDNVIDRQHMRIVEYINELDEAIQSKGKNRRDLLAKVIQETIEYTESHFGFEETMLEEVHYPYLKAHMRVHQLFVRRVLEYKERFNKGEEIAQEMLDTLAHWLLNHIKNEDKDYARWLKETDKPAPDETQSDGWLGRQLKRFFG